MPDNYETAASAIKNLSTHIQELILVSATQNHKIDSLETSNIAILTETKKLQQLVYVGNSQPPMTTTIALIKDKQKTHNNSINWLYTLFGGLFLAMLGMLFKAFSGQ